MFDAWASYDLASATQQLNLLTDPDVRDGALAALAGHDYVEPAQAIQYYNRIQSKELKARTALQLYIMARESDPPLAEQLQRDISAASTGTR